ncbi:hypothetical protein COU75_01630 [Candidatus Peregrinibacteria bacterium CG10_big_fil_rev_8_21_14_0_10_42_8]|nr:MAG: hypothetical protein COU75_01630 [Candidatus Peregrinibacteria bacterium CG10_big_fil_rev_8_21_14_0_10_42_8]
MNIILKSFEGDHEPEMVEYALKNLAIDTCISIVWYENRMPKISAKKHVFMSAEDLKAGKYENIDWNTITPLDEELIENMRHSESVFMDMIRRYSPEEIPYEERKRQYFMHLRYWNHILITENIDLFMCSHIPHQNYDIVLYDLCKLQGIPTLLLERCYLVDHFFMTESWQESAKELAPRIQELQKKYNKSTLVPLSERMEHYIKTQTGKKPTPWFLHLGGKQTHLKKKSFIRKWTRIGIRMILHKPQQFFSYIRRPEFWKRKIHDHQTIKMYNDNAVSPDPEASYIYFALQTEPEMSLCPMSGAYADQQITVELLASYIPKGILIYIKEHPEQGEWYRSKTYYQHLLSIPSVRLIKRDVSTFALMDNAKAVITGTGSVSIEGLLRQIPVIMMGHRFNMYAPDVHTIHSAQDMKNAIHSIFVEEKKPSMKNTRIFLKAVEELAGPTMIGTPQSAFMSYTKDEQAALMGQYMEKRILKVTAA